MLRFSNGNHAYALVFQRSDKHAAPPEVQAELFYQLLTAMLHEHRCITRGAGALLPKAGAPQQVRRPAPKPAAPRRAAPRRAGRSR